MRFNDAFLEELKSRLRPSDVIGRTVKLRRQGREFVGLSPFTKEKTPSFYVNDQKGFYHDFSSGKHGDLISFLQETQRLSFTEAVERLASEAGVALPTETPEARAEAKKQQSLGDWMDLAAQWFSSRLNDRTPGAQAARDTLKRRGLSPEDIARFGLGYAPRDRTALKDALVQRGARVSELVDCGLLIDVEGHAPYDRFRDRIIFPITDARSRVISFGGRALNPDEKAKYLNGPETTLFHKGRVLYGLPGALSLLGAEASDLPLLVVEGYMDVLACQRAGLPAVAPLGTALTEEQIEVLWRRHPEPTLCFDGDKAGQRAAARALDRALPKLRPGRSFKVCLLDGGKDPDDILREKGALALREAVTVSEPFVAALFRREVTQGPLDTPERKADLKKRLRTLSQTIEDRDLSEAYRRDLFDRFDALFAPRPQPYNEQVRPFVQGGAQGGQGRGGYASRAQPVITSPEARQASDNLLNGLDPLSAALAQGLLDHPDWIADHVEGLSAGGFGDPALEPLARALVPLGFQQESLDSAGLRRHLSDQGLGVLLSGVHKAAIKSGAPFLAPDLTAADAQPLWDKAFDATVRLAALERALDSAYESVGTELFSRLKTERDVLRRALRSGALWHDQPSAT